MAKKLERPLVIGGNEAYPLTTADQIIKADGSRLETENGISVDNAVNAEKLGGKLESELSVAKAVDSDTLGGQPASYYTDRRVLLYTNPAPLNAYDAQDISVDLTDCHSFEIIFVGYRTDNLGAVYLSTGVLPKGLSRYTLVNPFGVTSTPEVHIQRRDFTVTNTTMSFTGGYAKAPSATTYSTSNNICIPYQVYGYK